MNAIQRLSFSSSHHYYNDILVCKWCDTITDVTRQTLSTIIKYRELLIFFLFSQFFFVSDTIKVRVKSMISIENITIEIEMPLITTHL